MSVVQLVGIFTMSAAPPGCHCCWEHHRMSHKGRQMVSIACVMCILTIADISLMSCSLDKLTQHEFAMIQLEANKLA